MYMYGLHFVYIVVFLGFYTKKMVCMGVQYCQKTSFLQCFGHFGIKMAS